MNRRNFFGNIVLLPFQIEILKDLWSSYNQASHLDIVKNLSKEELYETKRPGNYKNFIVKLPLDDEFIKVLSERLLIILMKSIPYNGDYIGAMKASQCYGDIDENGRNQLTKCNIDGVKFKTYKKSISGYNIYYHYYGSAIIDTRRALLADF